MTAIVPTIDQVARPQAMGYDGYIDNVLIRLAVTQETPLEDVTADAAPPKVNTSESGEDVRDEIGERYSRSNLSGGAGLDFLHSPQRPDDASIRYWDSRGVDVFRTDKGDIYEATLMHQVSQDAAHTGIHSVCQVDGTVYFATATEIRESDNTLRYTGTGITRMVAVGTNIYILDSSGVGRINPATSWTRNAVSATTYQQIWGVKSRAVAVTDNVLYNADDDTAILTLPTGDTVNHVADAGPTIMVLGTTGSVYFLHLDQNLALVPAGEVPFVNEIPVLAVEAFGVVGIATAARTESSGQVARFYTARLGVAGSYTLEDLQLVYQVGDRGTTTDLTPTAIHATRDTIMLAVREPDELNITVWRYFLPTGGFSRGLEVSDDGGFSGTEYIADMVQVDDRAYFAVSNEGLWSEDDTYIATGWLVGPLADFFTSDPKQWVAGELSGGPLPSGAGLELYHTSNPDLLDDAASTSWQIVTRLLSGQSVAKISNIAGFDSRYHAGKLIFRSDSSRVFAPTFRSYSFRALPAPKRDILMRIPLNVSDQIESPGRRAIVVKGRGAAIRNALRAYEGEQVIIGLYRPEIKILALIEKFEQTIEVVPPRGSVTKVMYARIRGTFLSDVEGQSTQTSGASLGQDILGQKLLGVGEVNQ